MSLKKLFIIVSCAVIVTVSGNPTPFFDDDRLSDIGMHPHMHHESTDRFPDIGMHPHMDQKSLHSHKKVKRSFQIDDAEDTNAYWINKAKATIDTKLKTNVNTKKAKNVIMFLGDGFGHTTIAAARVHQGGESSKLAFEDFPYTASSKTYCVDRAVPDSACSGTAFLHGVKTNNGIIGLNAAATRGNCDDSTNEEYYTNSIAAMFIKDGRNAGVVTTTKITDATPASAYANIAERSWEDNSGVIKSGCNDAKINDIAEQLIRGPVGKELKVVLGGGSRFFLSTTESEHGAKGTRTDGNNLIKEWLSSKSDRAFVKNRKELMDLDPSKVDQLFGLFSTDNLPFRLETIENKEESIYPTLEEMTMKALDVLEEDDDGYFLLVEGGRIDHGHHGNQAKLAIEETLEFSKAIKATLDRVDLDETLIVVTADHSHVMTVAGYSPRGTDIFSASSRGEDGIPYFTLSYANGPGFLTHYNVTSGHRVNAQSLDTTPINFRFPAAVPLKSESHSGEDVVLFAVGPNAHVFKGALEQNLIAHIMAYASCVGDGLKVCQ
ncbi:membrane-bound alkaline phosphatase-like [Chironomus tepperi]|uniref:membrane-bound alkaline phosphatase-like n=1 Tax=Chironomus tepperi TaxID=113505 RepID=UPI00391F0265